MSKAVRTVPYPLLGENTLVLSDSLVLAKDENGDLALMFRSAPHAFYIDQTKSITVQPGLCLANVIVCGLQNLPAECLLLTC